MESKYMTTVAAMLGRRRLRSIIWFDVIVKSCGHT